MKLSFHKVFHALHQQLHSLWADDASHPAARQKRPWGLNRWVLLVIYMVYAILTSSVYFGWRSMSALLLKSGQFEWVCDDQADARREGEAGDGENPRYLCELQDAKIQSLFTIAMACHFTCSALAGWLLDSVGPKAVALLGQLFNSIAWLLLSFSSREFQAVYPAFVFMGAGADVSVYPTLLIVSLFPKNTAVIMALMGACISTSFFVPYVLKIFWMRVDISFRMLCTIYVLAGPLFCILLTLLFIPHKAFKGVDAFKVCVEAEKLRNDTAESKVNPKEEVRETTRGDSLRDPVGCITVSTTGCPATSTAEGRDGTAGEMEMSAGLSADRSATEKISTEWRTTAVTATAEGYAMGMLQETAYSASGEEDQESLVHHAAVETAKKPSSRRISVLEMLHEAAASLAPSKKEVEVSRTTAAATYEVADDLTVQRIETMTGSSVDERECGQQVEAIGSGCLREVKSVEAHTKRTQQHCVVGHAYGDEVTRRSVDHSVGDESPSQEKTLMLGEGISNTFSNCPKDVESKNVALARVEDFGDYVDDPRFKKQEVSFFSQSLTFLYCGICIYFVVCGWAMCFYQEAAGRFLSPAAEHNLELLTPLSTFPCIVFGFLINRLGIMSVIFVLNTFGVVMYICVLCAAGNIVAQQLSVVCFFFYISIFTTQVYVYIESTFDSNHFGKLIGGASMLGGLLSLLSNVFYGDVTVHLLSGDTRPVSGILICLLALMYPMLGLMTIQRRRKSKAQQLEVKKRIQDLQAANVRDDLLV